MCRLLLIKSKSKINIEDHLIKFSLIAKNSQEFQGHGWGCSYLVDNDWIHYKNIKPIWETDLTQFGKTTQIIAHVRSAFENKNIFIENNMPFYDNKYIFVFNGELRGVRINSEGIIGAEKIFNFIKRFESMGMKDAMKKATKIIVKRSSSIKAMNIIIADKTKVYFSSIFNENKDYYQMYYKKTENELVICSEIYPNETGWKKINNNSNGVFIWQ